MRLRALPVSLALLGCCTAIVSGCSGSSSGKTAKPSPTPSRTTAFHAVPTDVQAARAANVTGADFPSQEAWLATRLQPRASQDRLVLGCMRKKPLQDLTADVESSLYTHQLSTRGQAVAVIGEIAVKTTAASAQADLKDLGAAEARKCLQQVLAKSLLEAVPRTVEAVGVVATAGKAPKAAGAGAVSYSIVMVARSGNRSRRLGVGQIVFYVAGRAVLGLNEIASGGATVPPTLTDSLVKAVAARAAKSLH